MVSPPVINDDATIAYVAKLVGPGVTSRDDFALVLAGTDGTTVLARSGQPLPSGGVLEPLPGDAIGPFRGAPRLNDQGVTAFLGAFDASVDAAYASDLEIFVAGQRRIAPGDPSPDYPARRFFFDTEQSNPPALGPDGTFAVGLALDGGGFDSSLNHDAGLYRGSASQTALTGVAHRGALVPGGAARFQYPAGAGDWLGFGPPGINATGVLAFVARQELIDKTGLGPYASGFQDALYVTTGGLTRLVQSGDASPDGRGTLDSLYDVEHAPDINGSGDVALLASANADALIVLAGASSPVIVAREGDAAPSSGVYHQLLWQPSLDDAGDVAFVARLRESLTSTGSTGDAIFLGRPSGLREIVRTGTPTPDGDAVFAELGSSDTYSQVNANRPSLNQNGQLAFMASHRFNDGHLGLGLYVYDGATIRTVVRTGDALDGKIVADLGANTVTSPGVRAFDDHCDVALVVRYTDGSSAIGLANACSGR